MNTHQQQIISLFETAQNSIQVAVSWFTDEALVEKLINKAKHLKVELLLSADELNLFRHKEFRKLQLAGAKVHKLGSDNPLMGKFMHSKFIIIDGQVAYGGSYNFTNNAKTNYENFKKYDYSELASCQSDFNSWFRSGCDFFTGVTNAEEVVRRLLAKFAENEKQNMNFLEKMVSNFSGVEFSEEKYIESKEQEIKQSIAKSVVLSTFGGTTAQQQTSSKTYNDYSNMVIKEEVKKETLREVTQSIAKQETKIASNGTITQNTGVVSQTHRNYGGLFLTDFKGNKLPNCYGFAHYQKHFIEKNYSFLKCRIENDTLICVGEVQPDHCEKYKLRIEFRAGHHPQVFVTSPTILQSPDNHVYSNGSLCLFYPPDMKWKDSTKIAAYTIPWTIEWIMLYELWKLTGKWEAAEVLHKRS